jgi:hypothetical protein
MKKYQNLNNLVSRNFGVYTSWLVIIGLFSIINTIFYWFKFNGYYFPIGLATTQISDVLIYELNGEDGLLMAVLISCFISGLIMLMGVLSNKFNVFYYIGILFYMVDTIILLFFLDLFAILLHGIALFYLFKGVSVLKQTKEMENLEIPTTINLIQDESQNIPS